MSQLLMNQVKVAKTIAKARKALDKNTIQRRALLSESEFRSAWQALRKSVGPAAAYTSIQDGKYVYNINRNEASLQDHFVRETNKVYGRVKVWVALSESVKVNDEAVRERVRSNGNKVLQGIRDVNRDVIQGVGA